MKEALKKGLVNAGILVVGTVLFLVGWPYLQPYLTPANTPINSVCYNGVVYLLFPAGVTVEYNKDGKIQTCELPIFIPR